MNSEYCTISGLKLASTLRETHYSGVQWDAHKVSAQRKELIEALRETLGDRYAEEVFECSGTLSLERRHDNGRLSVTSLGTCKRRWCPICAWRKSLRQWALLVERLPGLVKVHSPCRFLLLTLTIRNCSLEDLPQTYQQMVDGWRRLTWPRTVLGRLWPATAWVRALEITFPRPKEAHPHFHVLLAVKPEYFSWGEYVDQLEWTKRWRQALRIDYDPIVDIRCVKPLNGKPSSNPLDEALGGLQEVSKYVVKPAEHHSRDALKALASLSRKRFIDSGGWLRGVFRKPRKSKNNLAESDKLATYRWHYFEKTYWRDTD